MEGWGRKMALDAITLNVFSNVASANAEHCLAPEAIRSYFACFDGARGARKTTTRVFLDPKPFRANHAAWIEKIRRGTEGIDLEIIETNGLIDSFMKSVEMTETPYAVQLEHDFIFLRARIPHGLPEMVEDMERHRFNYIRFNKRRNIRQGYDLFLEPMEGTEVPLCRINGRSNNPQIINVGYYLAEVVPLLRRPDGDQIGLEGGLCRYMGGGQLYGPLGWPKTVQHLDGRDVRFRDRLARKLYFWRHSKKIA
jgi:hypothetical protein